MCGSGCADARSEQGNSRRTGCGPPLPAPGNVLHWLKMARMYWEGTSEASITTSSTCGHRGAAGRAGRGSSRRRRRRLAARSCAGWAVGLVASPPHNPQFPTPADLGARARRQAHALYRLAPRDLQAGQHRRGMSERGRLPWQRQRGNAGAARCCALPRVLSQFYKTESAGLQRWRRTASWGC